MDVYVQGKKWMWKFAYPGGPELDRHAARAGGPPGAAPHHLARRHPLVLRARAPHQDGRAARPLHADLVRRRRSPAATRSSAPSTAASGHSSMLGELVVMPQDEFDVWIARAAPRRGRRARRTRRPPASGSSPPRHRRARGGASRPSRAASSATRVDGTRHIGPTWVDLYLRQQKLKDGKTVVADEALPHEVDDGPRRADRGRVPERHADVPGQAVAAGGRGHRRVHQVPQDGRRSAPARRKARSMNPCPAAQ